MIATLISLVLSGGLYYATMTGVDLHSTTLALPVAAVGVAVMAVGALINALMVGPLQRAGSGLSPKVIHLYSRDRTISWTSTYLVMFPLFSFSASAAIAAGMMLPFFVWLPLLGLALDGIRCDLRSSLRYLDPSEVVKILGEQAMATAGSGDPEELLENLDALTEVSLKALERTSSSLATNAVNAMSRAMQGYLEGCDSRSKSLSTSADDASSEHDTVSYTLFYLFQRLEMIHDEARHSLLEPVCTSVTSTLGKLAVFTAKYDMGLAKYPLHFISKLSLAAIDEEIPDVGIKATCTIQEVAKVVSEESELGSAGFKEFYLAATQHLEEIAKATFKRNKAISIPLLMSPFQDVKKTLQESRFKEHPDIKVVIKDLDRVLEEFSALSHVMTHIGGPKQPPADALLPEDAIPGPADTGPAEAGSTDTKSADTPSKEPPQPKG